MHRPDELRLAIAPAHELRDRQRLERLHDKFRNQLRQRFTFDFDRIGITPVLYGELVDRHTETAGKTFDGLRRRALFRSLPVLFAIGLLRQNPGHAHREAAWGGERGGG